VFVLIVSGDAPRRHRRLCGCGDRGRAPRGASRRHSADGTSVNPARSLGPALVLGGDALRQLWLFIAARWSVGRSQLGARVPDRIRPAATVVRVESGESLGQSF